MITLNTRLSFGQYRGQLVKNVLIHAPGYIKWLEREGYTLAKEVIIRLGNT